MTETSYKETLTEAENVLKELEGKLTNVSVNIDKNSGQVLEAIRLVFGSDYIRSDGTSTITFDMYRKVVDNLRVLGNAKVGEYIK